MIRKLFFAAVVLAICLGSSSCSILASSTQTLSIVATDPDAVIMVDGQKVGKGQASIPVKRNRSHAITGTTPDGRTAATTVGTSISAVGYVDLIGGILVFWPALIGCCTPGFRSLETDTVTLMFSEPTRAESMRGAATEAPPPLSAEVVSTGTGFFVGDSGRIVTCQHVVEGATSITVEVNGQELFADLETFDASNDLALLKLREGAHSDILGLAIACAGGAQVGEHVFTVGFPWIDIQGKEPKYTDGAVGSLSGLGGEARWLQVSVPVQPGNSGGPLLNDRGEVVGVVQARLSDIATLRAEGALPQGVNFAIKSAYLCAFLGSHAEHLATRALERSQAIEAARRAVCIVRARQRSSGR